MNRAPKQPPRRSKEKLPVAQSLEVSADTAAAGDASSSSSLKPQASSLDITDDRRAVALAPPKPKLVGRFRCESINSHQEKTLGGKKIVHVGTFVRTDKKHWFKLTGDQNEKIELSFADEETFVVGREYTVAFFDPAVFSG